MRTNTYKFWINQDIDTDTLKGPAIDVLHAFSAAIQCSWVGTSTGSGVLEVSLDGSTWSPLPHTVFSILGTTDSVILTLSNVSYDKMRLSVTSDSSDLTVTATSLTKGA